MRLARKRRHGRKGPLDFRSTVRHSLSYGGVPAEPKFKYPRPHKPEIVVLADISGSVAAFARFTLHLVYAIGAQFSKVRSFVFIDGVDEVTRFFEGVEDIAEAVHRVNTEADVVWVDGHSDYGHAFEAFWSRWGKEIGPKTTVIILGDARNNYHASQSWVLKEMQHRARHVYWLNPEPRSYWDTGDSIVGEYATHMDGVFECRNLRQLEALRRPPRVSRRDDARPRPPRRVRQPGERPLRLPRDLPGLSDLGRARSRPSATGWPRPASSPTRPRCTASVLPRAVETATILAPALGDLDVVQDCDFCEQHLGEGDGLSTEEFERRYPIARRLDHRPPPRPGRGDVAGDGRAGGDAASTASSPSTPARPSSSPATAASSSSRCGAGSTSTPPAPAGRGSPRQHVADDLAHRATTRSASAPSASQLDRFNDHAHLA